jgi:phosphoribosylformylglycinamidine cyclo-ligase
MARPYNPIKPTKQTILDAIKKTWQTTYLSVREGAYPISQKRPRYRAFFEVDHTDGIGTKGFYHWRAGTFREAVIDALAMNLNDLALARAVPYKLQNHITAPMEDRRVVEIVHALALECKKRKIAMTGGETSFHNNSDGLDISITVSAFIQNNRPNKFRCGDVLVGLKSNGLHANGFTKVRAIFGVRLRKEFTEPTAIYLDTILALDKRYNIHGMMHITGGAFSKLKDALHGNDALITRSHALSPQKIFKDIYSRGVSDKEMYTTFNCGIGFILSCSKKDAQAIVKKVPNSAVIGTVIPGKGKVRIESAFSSSRVVL